jgi:3-methyladenine DNA glycosylase AlkD
VTTATPLLDAIRHGLAELGDPEKAEGMRAYMRSEMPFRGVQKPARKQLLGHLFAAHPFDAPGPWREAVLALWREAAYREERYAALALLGDRRYVSWRTPALVPLYDELIVTGAWWDFVDEVATRHVGALLRSYREPIEPLIRSWSTDADLWRRRTSIICQVGAKADTDLDLLTSCILANTAETDFFLRKAIGWALRAYAWVDPAWVRTFLETYGDRLSGLSRREAAKNLGRLLA